MPAIEYEYGVQYPGWMDEHPSELDARLALKSWNDVEGADAYLVSRQVMRSDWERH